jgi:hypothetical protein
MKPSLSAIGSVDWSEVEGVWEPPAQADSWREETMDVRSAVELWSSGNFRRLGAVHTRLHPKKRGALLDWPGIEGA